MLDIKKLLRQRFCDHKEIDICGSGYVEGKDKLLIYGTPVKDGTA